MERLTARTKNGHAYLVFVKPDEQEVDSPYKNTLQCILDCFERLAQYEDLEEQGRLVVLPCKVGDTVYETLFEWDCTECLKTSFKPKVRERKVTHFMLTKSGDIILGVAGDGSDYLIYGKTVFLTRAAAEAALKEVDRERD